MEKNRLTLEQNRKKKTEIQEAWGNIHPPTSGKEADEVGKKGREEWTTLARVGRVNQPTPQKPTVPQGHLSTSPGGGRENKEDRWNR